jgi:hypothetical protein
MGFLLEAVNQAGLRSAQRGHDTEDEPGGEGEEQGEEEHGAIEFRIDEIARHFGRPEGPEETAAFVADAKSGHAAEDAEEHALSEQLAQQASATGADSQSNGDFLTTADCARHE